MTILAGLAGPFLVGALKHSTGDYQDAVLVLAAVMFCGAVFAYFMLPIISPDSTMRAVAVPADVLPDTELGDDAKGGPAAGRSGGDGGGGAAYSSMGAKAVAAQHGGLQLMPLHSAC